MFPEEEPESQRKRKRRDSGDEEPPMKPSITEPSVIEFPTPLPFDLYVVGAYARNDYDTIVTTIADTTIGSTVQRSCSGSKLPICFIRNSVD